LPMAVVGRGKHVIWSNDDGLWSDASWISLVSREGKGTVFDSVADTSYKIQYNRMEQMGWTLVLFSDIEQTYGPLRDIRKYVLLAMIISIAASLLLSSQISRKVAFPVSKLVSLTERYEQPGPQPNGTNGGFEPWKPRF